MIHLGLCYNEDSDSVGLRQILKFCISNKPPGDGDATVLGPHLSSTDLKETNHPSNSGDSFVSLL